MNLMKESESTGIHSHCDCAFFRSTDANELSCNGFPDVNGQRNWWMQKRMHTTPKRRLQNISAVYSQTIYRFFLQSYIMIFS